MANKDKEPRTAPMIPTDFLIKSKKFANYQPDFLRAILSEKAYTLDDAENLVKKYFKKGGS